MRGSTVSDLHCAVHRLGEELNAQPSGALHLLSRLPAPLFLPLSVLPASWCSDVSSSSTTLDTGNGSICERELVSGSPLVLTEAFEVSFIMLALAALIISWFGHHLPRLADRRVPRCPTELRDDRVWHVSDDEGNE